MRFVDTNVLLYAASREPEESQKRTRARALLAEPELTVSVQVLQEFYHQATRPTRKGRLSDASRVARVAPDGSCVVEPYRAALFAGLANLFISDGSPGPVLEIEVIRRTGAEGSLPQAMRAALTLAAAGGPIAMGGDYHFDVTPDAVHCRGWFAPAETVYRVGNIYARLRNVSRP